MSKRIEYIIDDIKEQYLEKDNNIPWIIGFSGGKDSTVVLTLVWRALLSIREELGDTALVRQVYVVNNDTLVENPIITDYDVGGKDELAVFYKLCNLLHIDCRIISDYDALFRGKLREFLCADDIIEQRFIEKGFGPDVSNCIGEIERLLVKIGDTLNNNTSENKNVKKIVEKLHGLYSDRTKNINTIKDVVLLSLYRFKNEIEEAQPDIKCDIETILAKHKQYLDCIKYANIFIIPDGELEHFFKASTIDYLNIEQKDKLFNAEREAILRIESKEEIEEKYQEILPLLKMSVPHVQVDMLKHVKYTIIDWIQKVQNAVVRNEIKDIATLKANARVEYSTYNQILECKDGDFTLQPDGSFNCTISLKVSVIGAEKQISFSDKTTPRDFNI